MPHIGKWRSDFNFFVCISHHHSHSWLLIHLPWFDFWLLLIASTPSWLYHHWLYYCRLPWLLLLSVAMLTFSEVWLIRKVFGHCHLNLGVRSVSFIVRGFPILIFTIHLDGIRSFLFFCLFDGTCHRDVDLLSCLGIVDSCPRWRKFWGSCILWWLRLIFVDILIALLGLFGRIIRWFLGISFVWLLFYFGFGGTTAHGFEFLLWIRWSTSIKISIKWWILLDSESPFACRDSSSYVYVPK